MQIEKVDHLSQLKLVFSNRTRQTQNKQTKKVDHDMRARPKAFQTMFVIFQSYSNSWKVAPFSSPLNSICSLEVCFR